MTLKLKHRLAICALVLLTAACTAGSEDEVVDTTAGAGGDVDTTTTVSDGLDTTTVSDGVEPTIDLDGSVTDIFAQLGELPVDERLAFTLERAREEGTLTLYTVSNLEHTEAATSQFTDLYGVEVEFIRLEDNVFSDRVLLENQAGQHTVDVMDVSGPDAVRLRDEGMFAPLSNAPVLPEEFPESAIGEFTIVHQTNGILTWWRTDRVSPDEAPMSIDDLLDPVWRGRVGITSAPDDLTIALLEERGEEGARDYLTALVVDNEAQIRQGHSGSTAALIAGEFDAHVALLASVSIPRMEEGAPIDWAFLPPYAVNAGRTYVYSEAPHPFAALLWIYFKSSFEGQQGAADQGSPSILPGVEQAFDAYGEINQLVVDGEAMIIDDDLTATHLESAELLFEEIIVPRISE